MATLVGRFIKASSPTMGVTQLARLDCVEEVELLCLALVIKMEWIVPAEAGITEAVGLAVKKGVHALSTEIGNAVRIDEFTDLFQGVRRGNELLAARRINPVITGTRRGW